MIIDGDVMKVLTLILSLVVGQTVFARTNDVFVSREAGNPNTPVCQQARSIKSYHCVTTCLQTNGTTLSSESKSRGAGCIAFDESKEWNETLASKLRKIVGSKKWSDEDLEAMKKVLGEAPSFASAVNRVESNFAPIVCDDAAAKIKELMDLEKSLSCSEIRNSGSENTSGSQDDSGRGMDK